jgi:hypothetical protein
MKLRCCTIANPPGDLSEMVQALRAGGGALLEVLDLYGVRMPTRDVEALADALGAGACPCLRSLDLGMNGCNMLGARLWPRP